MTSNELFGFISHSLSTSDLGDVRCVVYDAPSERPVTVLLVGDAKTKEAPLVRVHSRCLYAEVFGSLDCDCKSQINLAFNLFKQEGAGAFIYLEQEGRGCGLVNKAKAYLLREEKGLDTVDAYRKLGLTIDARIYTTVAYVLRRLGLNSIRLLTNNPAKVDSLKGVGIAVQQVALRTKPTPRNIDYLRVKQFKLNHTLGLYGDERDLANGP